MNMIVNKFDYFHNILNQKYKSLLPRQPVRNTGLWTWILARLAEYVKDAIAERVEVLAICKLLLRVQKVVKSNRSRVALKSPDWFKS